MILFQNDFNTQKAIVDVDTKNLSFIKMGVMLKKMGVDNHLFFLALTQPELQGYNPHDLKDNSIELRERILIECRINPWYYLREVLRVGASGGGIRYELNRANLAQTWSFLNCIDTFLTMPRQCGKSVGTIGTCSWVKYFGGSKVTIGLFAKGAKLVHENVGRLKEIRDSLPKYLLKLSPADENNKEGMSYAELGNKYLTFTAQKDKVAAEDQGRGPSIAIEHFDELNYYDNIWLSYVSATAAMGAAKPQCIASGCPAAIFITSTAGDLDDPRGRYGFKMVCDSLRFHEKLYDCADQQELKEVVKTNSSIQMLYIEYSYKQLGKSQEWFEDNTRNKDPERIRKDYLNEWLPGAGGSLFPQELIQRMIAGIKEPVTCTYYESLVIKWYQHPTKLMSDSHLRNKPYLFGSDTSDNVGRDFTTFVMVDPYDLSVVAEFRCNSTNLAFVTKAIRKFLVDFPRAIFIPERNKNGAIMIDFLLAMMQADSSFTPFTRFYNEYCQEYTNDSPSLRSLDLNSGLVRKKLGFTTGSNTRDMLYTSTLSTAAQLCADRLNTAAVVNEWKALTKRNGRIDHAIEGHDDTLIAYLLCAWFALFARNHHLYGIRADEILCNVTDTGDDTDPETKRRMTQMRVRGKELVKLIARASNSIIRGAYQRELDNIKAYLDEDFESDEVVVQPLDQLANQNAVTRMLSFDPNVYKYM